jgi:hypothetical protein
MAALYPHSDENVKTPDLHNLRSDEAKLFLNAVKDLIVGQYISSPQ